MSKKLFSKVFILLLVVGLLFAVAPTGQAMAQTPDTSWYTGDGPYVIGTADQLAGLAQLVNGGNNFAGKTISLSNDIDLAAYTNWTPIGGTLAFSGVFDGGNHTISNLTINRPDEEKVGLFGYVSGTIQNFTLSNANITGRNMVGGASGRLYTAGKVFNVAVTGIQINAKHYAGGIAGHVFGQLNNVQANNVTVTLTFDTVANDNGDKGGGLVGYMDETTLSNCSATNVTISGTRDVGGLVGAAGGSTITNCTSTGASVTSTNIDGNTLTPYTGGAVGRASGALTITNVNVTNATLTSTPAGYTGLVVGGGAGPVTLNNIKLVHEGAETFYATIQAAVTAATNGDTIQVSAGTYDEDVNINKSISLLGAGAADTIIRGVRGGDGATVRIAASNITIDGFTITRLGNNLADWNLTDLNFAGIAIQGHANTGSTITNNIIFGNRTGIDINDSHGHTIKYNQINDNRTGLLFRNQTDYLTLENNEIKNNWTMGILFLDASGGTNVPVQSALYSSFSFNDISGNWYGQVVERQSGGSLPLPGTTNLKNFIKNWWGTSTPVVSTANSTEPPYATQIPVAYGGTAVAPGGQPDILGPASANIVYIPWCSDATCTAFAGPVTNITQHKGYVTIQAAIDDASDGDVIEAGTGTYTESLNINKGVTLRAVDLIETVVLSDTAAPGVWYPDRYRPAVFQSATWQGRNAIQHGVRVADSKANRPAAYSSDFYNTQGRQYQTSLSGDVQRMSIDMWVDASWATNQAYAGLWSVGKNGSGVVSSYPIIAWRSTTGATPGFYIWDFSGWQLVKAAEASDYGKWHTLAIELRAGEGVQYYLDGQPAGAFLAHTDTVSLGNVILNVYNCGADYDVYWDNFSTSGVSIVGQATVNASNVTFDGFNLSNPGANYGMVINSGSSNVTITGNTFENIGGTAFADNVKGIYLLSGPDNVTIEGNIFRNIHAGAKSVNAVFSGDSNATDAATGLVIRNNVFEDITSATKGGYGILLNNGTGNPGVIIEGNSFNGISGGWTHAIGLEGPTPGALVNRNTFSGLTAGSADNTAVFFEANSGLATTNITNNQFLNAGFGVAVHPSMGTHPMVLATPNWWGQLTGPAAGQLPTGDYDTSPWCANAACTAFLPVEMGMDPVTNTAPICNTDTETIIAVKIGAVVELSGYTIKVNFDTTKAQVLDVYNGDILPAGGISIHNDLGNTTGQLILNYATTGAPINDADGGNLVYIKFKPLAVGPVVFTLDAGSQLTGTNDQILFPYTIDPLTSTLTVCGLVAENFNWTTGDTGGWGWLSGISAGFRLEEATFAGATSLVVELKDSSGTVLQRDTANIDMFASITQITAPFDMYGNFNYTSDGYWSNERFGDYGTTTQPACAVATAVLANGKTVTAENCNLTGDESTIELSLVAEDFGYMNWSNVLGVSAGFHPVNFGMDQAQSLKVELFTGTPGNYTLLQTNTAPVPGAHGTASGVAFSGPFDIFGSFNYATDYVPDQTYTFWNNARQSEYGQTAIPTRVLATVTMPGGLVLTAENTNLTGNRSDIILGDLTAGPLVWSNYLVSEQLGMLRGVSADFELQNNTFTGASSIVVQLFTAEKVQLLQTATAADLSKFAGMTWITAPFDIFGHFNYALDGYWSISKENPEYGQSPTVVPDCVVATATLFNGKVVTAERCGFTYGAREDILPGTFVGTDFGYYVSPNGSIGFSAGFQLGDDVTMADATSVVVQMFAGEQLLQTNTAVLGETSPWGTATTISGPFDVFGTFDYGADGYWSNERATPEYGQTVVPTKVVGTLTLKNGKVIVAEYAGPSGVRNDILPDITGLVTMQGRPNFNEGVPLTLTATVGTEVHNTTSNGLSSLNYIFDAVEGYTYTFTTNQPRYLNITADLAKTILADKSKTLPDLRLRAGNAVWTDNIINTVDAGQVGTDWNGTFEVTYMGDCGDVNFDGFVNIQDLALVGGNYELTNAQAYGTWAP